MTADAWVPLGTEPAPCGRDDCSCLHMNCVVGRVPGYYLDGGPAHLAVLDAEGQHTGERVEIAGRVKYETWGFCPTCCPEQYEIQITSRTREEMGRRLRARGAH